MSVNCIMRGISYCFARFTGDVWGGPDSQMLMEDIQVIKPTIFGSFPIFFNRIYHNVISRLPE
jgi:hypothetical protein